MYAHSQAKKTIQIPLPRYDQKEPGNWKYMYLQEAGGRSW